MATSNANANINLVTVPQEALEHIVGFMQGPSSRAMCNALGRVVEGHAKCYHCERMMPEEDLIEYKREHARCCGEARFTCMRIFMPDCDPYYGAYKWSTDEGGRGRTRARAATRAWRLASLA